MEIILCAVQSHLATAWRDRIGSRLAATVRVPMMSWSVISPGDGPGSGVRGVGMAVC